MKLNDCLGLQGRGVTAIVGGGGKTSLMYRLALESASEGETAFTTTTTRIYPPEDPNIILLNGGEDFSSLVKPGKVYCLGIPTGDGKLHYPGDDALDKMRSYAFRVYVEADGARHYPIKVPNYHEPVIPTCADSVIAVAGLDALGGKLSEVCFRYELACDILKSSSDAALTPGMLAALLCSPYGQRKSVSENAGFAVVLNKADDEERCKAAYETVTEIKKLCPGCRVIVTALREKDSIKAIYI